MPPAAAMSMEINDMPDNSRVSSKDTQEISDAPAPVTHQGSFLYRLPLEIRELIYQNLLVSDHVKEASPNLQAETYRFHPAILATNRSIALEARPFLQKNIFVLVITNWNRIYKVLKHEGVPVVSDHHLAGFKEHLLDVWLEFPELRSDKRIQEFLIVAADLPKFCRFIRMTSLKVSSVESGTTQLWLRLRAFKVHTPTLQMQKLLLNPFKQVYGGSKGTRASITGLVDASYRREVLTEMLRNMGEISAERWSVFQFCQEIKQEGDVAFHLAKWERAQERYIECADFMNYYRENLEGSRTISQTGDGWQMATFGLAFRVLFNLRFLTIKCKAFDYDIESWWMVTDLEHPGFEIPGLPKKSDVATMNHHLGLLYAERGHNRQATRQFREALRHCPENQSIRRSLRLVKGLRGRYPHDGISQRVLDDSIMEESTNGAEVEIQKWHKTTVDVGDLRNPEIVIRYWEDMVLAVLSFGESQATLDI